MTRYFDFEQVLDADFDKEIFPVEVSGQQFLIRRMNGAEYADFQADNVRSGLTSGLIVSVLAKHVYYNEAKPIPIKTVKAERLLINRYDIAVALTVEIAMKTREYLDGIAKEKEIAAKN